MTLKTRRQLHVWVSDGDHRFLSMKASDSGTTIAALVRGMIRQWARQDNSRAAVSSQVADDRNCPPWKQVEHAVRYSYAHGLEFRDWLSGADAPSRAS